MSLVVKLDSCCWVDGKVEDERVPCTHGWDHDDDLLEHITLKQKVSSCLDEARTQSELKKKFNCSRRTFFLNHHFHSSTPSLRCFHPDGVIEEDERRKRRERHQDARRKMQNAPNTTGPPLVSGVTKTSDATRKNSLARSRSSSPRDTRELSVTRAQAHTTAKSGRPNVLASGHSLQSTKRDGHCPSGARQDCRLLALRQTHKNTHLQDTWLSLSLSLSCHYLAVRANCFSNWWPPAHLIAH